MEFELLLLHMLNGCHKFRCKEWWDYKLVRNKCQPMYHYNDFIPFALSQKKEMQEYLYNTSVPQWKCHERYLRYKRKTLILRL